MALYLNNILGGRRKGIKITTINFVLSLNGVGLLRLDFSTTLGFWFGGKCSVDTRRHFFFSFFKNVIKSMATGQLEDS